MQIALQDVRKLGYKKIMLGLAETPQQREILFKYLQTIYARLCNIKCSAFSFPKKYHDTVSNTSRYYDGMLRFLRTCEPMIDNIEVTQICQRKFRNQWTSLWQSFSKDLHLSEQESALLCDLGIKLYFSDDTSPEVLNVIKLFNSILNWYIFTQSESVTETMGYDVIDLLTMLSTNSNSDFVEFVAFNLFGG